MSTGPLDLLAPLCFFGTPIALVAWGVAHRFSSPRKSSWQAWAAVALWLAQAVPIVYTALLCIGGHCQLSALKEYGPLVLMAFACVGIVWLVISAYPLGDSGRGGT